MDKHLHIVSHDIPWPVKHGGLVDLYYKIKSLHSEGIKIHLHCFYKNIFTKHNELVDLCEEVFYYPRRKFPSRNLPYIVSSRISESLNDRLLMDTYPILLEGIHCTAILMDARFKNRKILVRLHNTEHIYYRKLFEIEKGFKKWYYQRESKLLADYEQSVASKALFLAVSQEDCRYYRERFNATCEFLPVFVPWKKVYSIPGAGTYTLYHGNLSVNENSEMAARIIDWIDPCILKIAGNKPPKHLVKKAEAHKVELIMDPDDRQLDMLIKNGHVNILPSLNSTGVKLKLLNALFNGRHCLVNEKAVLGSGIEKACIITEETKFGVRLSELMKTPFTKEMITERENLLQNTYNNRATAKMLISYLY